jgi:hypothetical protein
VEKEELAYEDYLIELRDKIAIAVVQGAVANNGFTTANVGRKELAIAAYLIADEVLEQRAKSKREGR